MKSDSLLIGRKKHRNNPIDLDLSAMYPDVRIKTASRTHARIKHDSLSHTFSLENLGRNGTRVNGILYEKQPCILKDSSVITIGKVNLRLKSLR